MDPLDLRYHKEHEWIRVSGSLATLGISNFAQRELGDLVFIDLPKPSTPVAIGDTLGEVESTKTTSTIYAPVSGTVVEVNEDLQDHPELANTDPYGKGWMLVIELADPSQVDSLMTADQYQAFLGTQGT